MLGSIGLLVVTMAAQQQDPAALAGWLAGCWELRAGTRVTIEMWMPPAGGMMLGASRTTAGNRTREFEQLQLLARGDTLLYIASPSGQATTTFRSVRVTPELLRFENPQHDFPQVIIYRRISADSIHARVEGPGQNNALRGIDYRYRRVDCASAQAAQGPVPVPVPVSQPVPVPGTGSVPAPALARPSVLLQFSHNWLFERRAAVIRV